MQPQHGQLHQQQQGFPTVTAPYGRGVLPNNHQQTQSPYGPPKQQMLHNIPGSFAGSAAQGACFVRMLWHAAVSLPACCAVLAVSLLSHHITGHGNGASKGH